MLNTKKYLITTLGILLLMAGAFYAGGLYKELQILRSGGIPSNAGNLGGAPTPQVAGEVDPVTEADHVRGNRNAKIALIEYSDYECPYCQSFHSTAQQVVEDYGDEVMWVYRHFPLDSIHPNARPAAIASECVAKLGGNEAFWAYSDALFASATLSQTTLLSLATDMGFDISSCLETRETESIVDAGLESGSKAGVTGTPGNIIMNIESGETLLLPGALPFAQISQAIDSLK